MAGEKNENGVLSFMPYLKPPDQTAWEKFTTTIYNGSEGTVLGRTPKSWAQVLIFYTIFYAVLSALFSLCMYTLFSTLNDKSPKWQMDESLIGSNPGMGFRPISNRTEEGSLIWFDSTNATSVRKWVDLLDYFLIPYTNKKPGTNQVPCDFGKRPKEGEACDVIMDEFEYCSPENDYGYNTSSPCVFLKLNRIFGWTPEFYNDVNNLPNDMPDDLVAHIKAEKEKGQERLDQIWVSCQGENPFDKESVNPIFDFFPNRGFAGYYYPFTNVNGYLSPLVAVRVKQPTPNVIVNIECRAWAKNINYRGGNREREGSVHFEIMRDVN